MRNQAKQLMSASLASTLLATAPCAFAEQWEFSIAPLYLWGKNIEGAATAGGNELPLDLDFKDDILDNLDAAFAIHVEATNGTLTLFAEYNYANLDPTVENTIGPITVEGDVTFKDTMSEGGIAWVFADHGCANDGQLVDPPKVLEAPPVPPVDRGPGCNPGQPHLATRPTSPLNRLSLDPFISLFPLLDRALFLGHVWKCLKADVVVLKKV